MEKRAVLCKDHLRRRTKESMWDCCIFWPIKTMYTNANFSKSTHQNLMKFGRILLLSARQMMRTVKQKSNKGILWNNQFSCGQLYPSIFKNPFVKICSSSFQTTMIIYWKLWASSWKSLMPGFYVSVIKVKL